MRPRFHEVVSLPLLSVGGGQSYIKTEYEIDHVAQISDSTSTVVLVSYCATVMYMILLLRSWITVSQGQHFLKDMEFPIFN